MKLQGIFPALATPFNHEGTLYRAKVLHNIEKLNSVALSGYLVCGSTGEAPLLGYDEKLQLFEWVKSAAAPEKILIAGVGVESVHETVRLANQAAEIGYHAALVLTPFYFRHQMQRPETQALFFRAVADRSQIPVLLYNIPQATGYDLPVDSIAALSEHPNIFGIKDSSGDMPKLRQTVAAAKPGFQVLTGSGNHIWEALKLGASGAILAIANALPYACQTIWEAFRTREEEAGLDWQERIRPLSQLIGGPLGIAGLKHAMDLNGYYGGPPRLPMVPVSAKAIPEVEDSLAGLVA